MVLCNPSWACCVTFSDRLVLYFCIIHVVITTWVVALLHILAHFGVQSLTASIATSLSMCKILFTYFWMEKWAHFQFSILLLLPSYPKFAPSLKMEGADLHSTCWLHSCLEMNGSQQLGCKWPGFHCESLLETGQARPGGAAHTRTRRGSESIMESIFSTNSWASSGWEARDNQWMVASTLGGGQGPPRAVAAPSYQRIYCFIIIRNMNEILQENAPFHDNTCLRADTIFVLLLFWFSDFLLLFCFSSIFHILFFCFCSAYILLLICFFSF